MCSSGWPRPGSASRKYRAPTHGAKYQTTFRQGSCAQPGDYPEKGECSRNYLAPPSAWQCLPGLARSFEFACRTGTASGSRYWKTSMAICDFEMRPSGSPQSALPRPAIAVWRDQIPARVFCRHATKQDNQGDRENLEHTKPWKVRRLLRFVHGVWQSLLHTSYWWGRWHSRHGTKTGHLAGFAANYALPRQVWHRVL